MALNRVAATYRNKANAVALRAIEDARNILGTAAQSAKCRLEPCCFLGLANVRSWLPSPFDL